MYRTVNRCQHHRGIRKELVPCRERLVGGERDAFSLVALGNQLEQHAGPGLVTSDVADVIEDQQIKAIELGEFARANADRAERAVGAAPNRWYV